MEIPKEILKMIVEGTKKQLLEQKVRQISGKEFEGLVSKAVERVVQGEPQTRWYLRGMDWEDAYLIGRILEKERVIYPRLGEEGLYYEINK